MDDRLALTVTLPDGTTRRWGADERSHEDVPDDLSFSTSDPGGFRSLSCSLLRSLGRTYVDQRLLTNIRAYGAGNRTAWEGRFAQFPYADGTVRPDAVGWGAHLKDDQSLLEVFVDRDMSHWGAPPFNRRAAVTAGNVSMGDFSWAADAGGLMCALPTNALGSQTIAELWYAMPPGLKAAAIAFIGATNGTLTGYTEGIRATDVDSGTSSDFYAWTLNGALQGPGAFTTPRRYVALQIWSNGSAITPPAGANRRFSNIAIYGNHGLTLRTISGEPSGFYIPDMVRNIVQRWAPMLNIGEIETDTFVCPHAVFLEPTTAEDAISQLNAYLLWQWLVYDNRTFHFRAPDPARLTWKARQSRGAKLTFTGDDAEQQFNGVLVSYQDALGVRRIAGPPAAYWEGATAKADTTSTALIDTSATNAVNVAGIPRRWAHLSISFPTNSAGAEQIGAIWLAEHALPQRRGEITLQGLGSIEHPGEGVVPTWRVRAGDYVSVGDIANDTPRRIISTNYTARDRTLTAQLDNTVFKLEALFERVGINLIGVI